MKEGDLPVTILYLEAAILQEPNDAEVFTLRLFVDKRKGTPFSTQRWNGSMTQSFASHDWLKQLEQLWWFWNNIYSEIDNRELSIRWESTFEMTELPNCHLKALKRDNIWNASFPFPNVFNLLNTTTTKKKKNKNDLTRTLRLFLKLYHFPQYYWNLKNIYNVSIQISLNLLLL